MEHEHKPARQLEELQRLFLQRLEQTFAQLYGEAMDAGVITPEEARQECRDYYDKYKSGLQGVYSYYTEQWAWFHTLQAAPPEEFRTRLSNLTGELEKKYGPTVFNAGYYLHELNKHSPATEAWERLRGFFLDRWCRELSDREYNYQSQHIERLCADFARSRTEAADLSFSRTRNASELMDARIAWVKRHLEPKMKQRVTELAAIMRRNPIVRELAKQLGRSQQLPERKFKALSSRNETNRIRRASHTDIRGVTMGDELSHLLPIEYSMLATPRLYKVFLKRYVEKQLQMFDSRSMTNARVRRGEDRGNELSLPQERGPVIACVDTSASMAGTYEEIAKAIVLCVIFLAEREQRPCRVILFSSDIHTIEFRSPKEAFERLAGFFCNTFHGATDFTPVVTEAIRTLRQDEYSEADLLMLSDFDAESLPASLHLQMEDMKEQGVEVYAVAFGHRVNGSYIDLSDHNWHYQ